MNNSEYNSEWPEAQWLQQARRLTNNFVNSSRPHQIERHPASNTVKINHKMFITSYSLKVVLQFWLISNNWTSHHAPYVLQFLKTTFLEFFTKKSLVFAVTKHFFYFQHCYDCYIGRKSLIRSVCVIAVRHTEWRPKKRKKHLKKTMVLLPRNNSGLHNGPMDNSICANRFGALRFWLRCLWNSRRLTWNVRRVITQSLKPFIKLSSVYWTLKPE